jgi:DNA-damage-inducible protein D
MRTKKEPAKTEESRIVVFQERTIRRTWHNNEWWFSVIDVVGVLSESDNPKRYWSDLKRKIAQESGMVQPYEEIVRLKLKAPDGKQRETDCTNTKSLFRIIQSIPSPKAEPFKQWLAKVGYERVKEIEDPELASLRARELYQAKGYSQAWKERGVSEGREYSILTAEIARATFGVTPGEHGKIKGLDRVKTGKNLRDHMTDLELIFTMLGEAGTTEIARKKNAQGFTKNRTAAREGGNIAGNARRALEAKTGTPVVSSENFLNPPQNRFSETAAVAFIETQAEALTPNTKDLPKTRRRVKRRVRKAIKDLGGAVPEDLAAHQWNAKRFGRGRKKLESGK